MARGVVTPQRTVINAGGTRARIVSPTRPFLGRCRVPAVSSFVGTSLETSKSVAFARRLVGQRRQAGKPNGLPGRCMTVAAASYDYDLVIIGAGVGGHGAAIHAVESGLKTAIIEGGTMGGTCVNRGCIPSKALLAASGRIREMRNEMHMNSFGIQVGAVNFTREGVAEHADQLVKKLRGNLTNSMVGLGVDVLEGEASFVDANTIKYGFPGRTDVGGQVTAKNIIIATGSVPFVPPGIEIDNETVFTSDDGVKLKSLPEWVAIIGSGYIGLEFSDVYTALGSDVTFIEAMDQLTPGFDEEIAKLAKRLLIDPRNIDWHTGVFATKVTPGVLGEKPVEIELTDKNTMEVIDTLEVDACLVATGRAPFTKGLELAHINVETDRRGFVPVTDKMEVVGKDGEVVEGVYCIGDANGVMMLAHAASAQGISVIENICGRSNVLDHNSVPAACFTHPEIAFCGLTEKQAQEKADAEGFNIAVAKTSFKANSKALAELESDGLAKMIYNKETGEILGVHIIGIHASDLIHEASNAIATKQTVQDIKFAVHTHPTLSEVIDELFKSAKVGMFECERWGSNHGLAYTSYGHALYLRFR